MRAILVTLLALAAGCADTPPPVPGSSLFTHGVASGDMTSDSVVLWTRTIRELQISPEVWDGAGIARMPARTTGPETDFTAKFLVTGLAPGTKYAYRFASPRGISAWGSFKTAYAPGQRATVRMAFTGDADWKWKPYPLLACLAQEDVDFFFFLGDLIYESTDYQGKTAVEDLAGYRFKYRENREPRRDSASHMVPMRDLYAAFGQYSVFDNHETGYSQADANAPPYPEGGAVRDGGFVNQTPGFRERLQAYREYQPVREEAHAGTADARTEGTSKFYRAYSWGANVELIVLDDRSYRDARLKGSEDSMASSCTRTMLGPVQLAWFRDALLAAKRRNATWKVVVISSPIQELGGPSQVGVDMDAVKSWAGGYRCERNRILAFIDDNAIDNVVFLTTDNHYTVINDLYYDTVADDRKSPRKRARNAFEIMTGPLGAITGTPPWGRKMDIAGLSRNEADRRIRDVWNGDAPDADGKQIGLRQAGLPTLERATFNNYGYALLTFGDSRLDVSVKTIPNVVDPATLDNPAALAEYESRRPQESLRFSVSAR